MLFAFRIPLAGLAFFSEPITPHQYGTAIWDFQRAKYLDPGLVNARLYLATTYAAQYVPGAPGEANQELGRKAVDEFRGVLYGSIIEEGIESPKHAIELRPNYDDAMAYLNLMYRRKADTVESQDERDELLKMADDLVDRVKETKEKRTEAPNQP